LTKIKSAAPNMEVYSAKKKPLLSKFRTDRTDTMQLEQELSQQHTTLGCTPSQLTTTPPYQRSGAKRRKLSDDPFKSIEKQVKAPQQSTIRQRADSLIQIGSLQQVNSLDQLRCLALSDELQSLQRQRNELCDQFLTKRCDIPHFCI